MQIFCFYKEYLVMIYIKSTYLHIDKILREISK
ncbi:hypothetical protein HH_1175 [Helicobacter hepaticus ATCC 51449]|uniref:Uncharacterized protein n=1 Tax=Helicobacter hepaticus (strain ATCC 51449 / 3B1) TaxID=235279 RepID=Q7VGZ2_HELHP|nr:hypothetical protein HH_1175 [Helicobacter hepaticus ATCC 51449]